MLNKNQKIIAISVILILGGIIYLSFLVKEKQPEGGSFKTGEGTAEEVFTLSGKVLNVDAENNALTVESANEKKELKVVISETTKLIKLELPFGPENPPEPGVQFTPEQTEISLGDFKEGDEIFIKTKENIAGKTEFDGVEFIQILP